jgi:PhnB protein
MLYRLDSPPPPLGHWSPRRSKKAFAAKVVDKNEAANGTVGHAVVEIGDSVLECSEAHGQWGPRPVAIHVYVPDVDSVYQAAIATGAASLAEPKDQFYGERNGALMDEWGNHWYIATHLETLTEAEVRRSAAERAKGGRISAASSLFLLPQSTENSRSHA